MHPLQKRVLDLTLTKNLANLTLREIGEKIGESHPQKVKHHLSQLFKKGFLKENKSKNLISRVDRNQKENLFYSIPVLGAANCGQALSFAEENYEGYLQVSKSLIPNFNKNVNFAIKAIGNSMNKANIDGNNLEEGDYVIIDKSQNNLNFYENKYVLSIINGMANIKKLIKDEKNKRLILLSESTQDYPPIIIQNEDSKDYLINGIVVKVVKKP